MARFNWAAKLADKLKAEPQIGASRIWFYALVSLVATLWTFLLGYAADNYFATTPHVAFFDVPQLTINLFNTLVLTPAIIFAFFWMPSKQVSSAERLEGLGLIQNKNLSSRLRKAVYDPYLLTASVPTAGIIFLLMVFWAWPLESQNMESLTPFLLSPWLWGLYSLWFIPVIAMFATTVFRMWRTVEIHRRFFANKRNLVHLQIINEDKLGGFGELGNYYIGVGLLAAVFMSWAMVETIALPLLAGHKPDPIFVTVIVIVYLFLLQRFLFRSSLAIHRAMKSKKLEKLREFYDWLETLNLQMPSTGGGFSNQHAKTITMSHSLTEQITYMEKNLPEWPYKLPQILASWTLAPQVAAVAFIANLFDIADGVRKIMP